ncbi:hypothetical protein [Pelagovum pacificum]|uniref:Uncharacterized protein n=1 Tax=Pelagovum pacificum TaxID=2588711 RepID=A0A5C5GF85_9RHOB|nr:hypothetical protein [Pelagovum pacificum]QQA43438.1 hypothetical protein I8N54_02360 [Pelagovum pacificum]TNY33425.1 hypothetical protein FHY64_09170 [Pelagovum pacificum]
MKIESTDRYLVIESTPWVFGLIIVGLMLVMIVIGAEGLMSGNLGQGLGIGLGGTAFLGLFFAMFIRRNQLILDRDAGELIHRRRTVLRYTEVRHALDQVDSAVVETSRNSDGADTHRMSYVLSGGMDLGVHPFTDVYSSGRGARKAADAMNDWLSQLRPAAESRQARVD